MLPGCKTPPINCNRPIPVSHSPRTVRRCLDGSVALPRPLVAVAVLPLLRVTSAPPRVGTEKRATRADHLLRDVAVIMATRHHQEAPAGEAAGQVGLDQACLRNPST